MENQPQNFQNKTLGARPKSSELGATSKFKYNKFFFYTFSVNSLSLIRRMLVLSKSLEVSVGKYFYRLLVSYLPTFV